MTTTTTPVAIDYTSKDYAGFRESMLSFATTLVPDWKGAANGDPNDFGVVLVELLAYEGDILSYYNDRVANESFLSTATQRGSVLAHASLLDYAPRSATAASTVMAITVISPDVGVTIPAGFQVETVSDGTDDTIIFETTEDLTFPADVDPQTLEVPATEGETIDDETVATSCGDLDEAYMLGSTPVILDSVQIRVIEDPADTVGNVWFVVNNLLDAGPTDNAYSISLDENDAATVQFGDGVNGRIPPRGAVIHATYRVGGGADGNVEAGTITDVVDPSDFVYEDVIDPVTGDPVPPDPNTVQPPIITIINSEAATGGTDPEDVDSIRTNAPRALRARDRAVSLSDYEAIALSVPTVQLAKAKAVSTVYTNVILYVAPPGGAQPDQNTLNAVVAYFQTRKLANVTVVAAGPQYVSIDVELQIDVDPRYSQVNVKQAVRNALQDLLSFDNVDFGGRVSLSNIYTAASNVPGVTSVLVSELSRDGVPAAADVLLRENELPIQGRFTLIATGGVVNSGAGDLIGDGSTTVDPTASDAPSISLLRCDPNSTHIELFWNGGANTDYWDVVVVYVNSSDEMVSSTTVGPFNRPQATLDLPLIGHGRATELRLVTQAYNANAGPVNSPVTTTTYTCEG